MSAKDNGGGSSDPFSTEETLKMMKLTSEEERSLYEKVLVWWEAKNLRLSITISHQVGASLLTRLLFCTAKCVEATTGKLPPKSPHDELDISTRRDAKEPSFVTPEEEIIRQVVNESKQKRQGMGAKKVASPSPLTKASSHVPDSVEVALEGIRNLASDFASLLAASAKPEEHSKSATPTVIYIASAYYLMLRRQDRSTPTLVASEMVRIWNENASDDEILAYSALFEKTLLGASQASKSSVESYADFEFIWLSCISNSHFCEAILRVEEDCRNDDSMHGAGRLPNDATASIEQRLWSLQQVVWKLSCLIDEQRKELNDVAVSGRRQRILCTVASIVLVLSLPNLAKLPADPQDFELEQGKGSSIADNESSYSEYSRTHRKPLTEDALDALRTMVEGRSFQSPLRRLIPPPLNDPMDVIMASVNNLLCSLQPSVVDSAITTPITPREMEDAVTKAAELAMLSLSLIPSLGAADTPSSHSMANSARDHSPESPAVVTTLQILPPTKSHLLRLLDAAVIDEAISATVQKRMDALIQSNNAEASISRIPFVDERNLVSDYAVVVPFLCMTSSKASSSVALVSRYEGGTIVSSRLSSGVMDVPSLMLDDNRAKSMRETLELNEWTAAILDISKVRPTTRLVLYLEASDDEFVKRKRNLHGDVAEEISVGDGWRTVIAPLFKRVFGRLIDDTPTCDKATGRITVSDKDGSVIVVGDENDVETKLCKALVALYYQALEAILYHETARLKSASHPKLIMSAQFHRALLTCCCICLVKGLCSSSALALSEKFLDLDLPCIQQIMESCPYAYLKVSESFARALNGRKVSNGGLQSTQALGLPRILQRELSQCEVVVIDSLLWSREPKYSMDLSVMDIVVDIKHVAEKGAGPAWPPDVLLPTLPEEIEDTKNNRMNASLARTGPRPPDHIFFSYVVRKLLKIAFFRISALCRGLSIPPVYPVVSQVWLAFRYLLRNNIEILYDRHIDQLILSTLYGVCKRMKVDAELTFSRTIEVYSIVRGAELGTRVCHRLMRHIRLPSDVETTDVSGPNKRRYGNIIQFYNDVLVPVLKNHLLHSLSLKKACTKLQEYMADRSLKTLAGASAGGCEATAVEDDKLANDSGSWVKNDPTTVPVKEGNVQMNVLVPSATSTMDSRREKRRRVSKVEPDSSFRPENRSFFTFGEASVQNVNLMNRVAAEV